MPALVVLVHDDPGFLVQASVAFRANDIDVAAFIDPMAAFVALETPRTVMVLITCVVFGSGSMSGVALSLLARRRRPAIKTLFVAPVEFADQVRGLGDFMTWPSTVSDIVEKVRRLLFTTDRTTTAATIGTFRDV